LTFLFQFPQIKKFNHETKIGVVCVFCGANPKYSYIPFDNVVEKGKSMDLTFISFEPYHFYELTFFYKVSGSGNFSTRNVISLGDNNTDEFVLSLENRFNTTADSLVVGKVYDPCAHSPYESNTTVLEGNSLNVTVGIGTYSNLTEMIVN
jgi:hypothetical protein